MAALLMEEEEEDLPKAAGAASKEGERAAQAAAVAAAAAATAQSKAKGKGKAKAGGGGGGGASSSKPKAAASSGEASTSQQGSDQRSTPLSASTAEAAGPVLPPATEPALHWTQIKIPPNPTSGTPQEMQAARRSGSGCGGCTRRRGCGLGSRR